MSDENNYRYDVFISYRWVPPDQAWVQDQLEPALTNAGLEVCLDVEDFVPGRDVIEEMTRAGKESKRGLCVLTPDYVNDPDRMVNFERLMLRRKDPSGRRSRLIPFILRPTEVPDDIFGLVSINWTNPKHHAREWTKLLKVLEATNLNAPPPGPLEIDPNQPLPPPAPPPVRPSPHPGILERLGISKRLWIGIAAVMFLVLAGISYKVFAGWKIEGTIYYKQPPGSTARIPVKDVEVFLSGKSLIRSKRTGPDGKFVLSGVPLFASSITLTAIYGSQNFTVPYDPSGVYLVIPSDQPKTRNFVSCRWTETSDPCLPDDGRESAIAKVYKCDVEFPTEARDRTALLTIELTDAPETTIRSASVLATPNGSYRDEGEVLPKFHTWRFNLADSGLKTRLLVCLGSDDPAAQISGERLITYYTLP